MKKGIGIFLTLAGLVATVITGMNALDQSESFSAFGTDVVISQADYTPVIISAVVLIVGVFLWAGSKK
jgi:predicted cation transporter